jgi:hypothetical protein
MIPKQTDDTKAVIYQANNNTANFKNAKMAVANRAKSCQISSVRSNLSLSLGQLDGRAMGRERVAGEEALVRWTGWMEWQGLGYLGGSRQGTISVLSSAFSFPRRRA